MLTLEQKNKTLASIIKMLELPDSAYQKAKKRYEDIGEWFNRDDSLVRDNNPHIFSQGSFRLGTAIRPLDDKEEYDLDLACKLREGINQNNHTQKQLKELVRAELESYRVARGIEKELKEKRRCLRLEYKDDLNFHIDIVPCIPADESRRKRIFESMRSGFGDINANSASETTVSITDDCHPNYHTICNDWKISNPEGYAWWFENSMRRAKQESYLGKAQVDDIPLFLRKTPLQRAIQLLKRHRDVMFRFKPDSKPISIIITTLATRAYKGKQNVYEALNNILQNMESFINVNYPRVPNPVDPKEDFADKWYDPKYSNLKLEENFNLWVFQAKQHFQNITSQKDASFITEQVERSLSLKLNSSNLAKQLGFISASANLITPKKHTIQEPLRPHCWTQKK